MTLGKSMSGDFGSGVGYVRSLSRKRILIRSASSIDEDHCSNFDPFLPLKRQCSGNWDSSSQPWDKSMLESLPQDILIKIVCGVTHDDLQQLFLVSKAIREVTRIAKEAHFAYATPLKVRAFRNSITPVDRFDKSSEDEEAPNAPLRPRRFKMSQICEEQKKRKINKDDLSDISVALFASDPFHSNSQEKEETEAEAEERWLRRKLF